MQSREATIKSLYGVVVKMKLGPYGNPKASDSANLDSAAELLLRSGRSPAEALMLLVPEAYKNHPTLLIKYPEIVDFYDYYKGQMEAWDGPALLLFSDGKTVGACLDRNGLRPARYWRTIDNVVYVASEVGVLPMDESKVVMKGRLGPGMMITVDLESGQVYENTEVKKIVASSNPYKKWAFGYSSEDVQMVIETMAAQGKEPTFCMGDDIPLAVLSQKPHMLYDYFKQRFAQVTNPAIDPLREDIQKGIHGSIDKAIQSSCVKLQAIYAVRNGSQLLVLSDRSEELEPTRPAIPILLAVGAVHQHLIQNGLRMSASIVADTAQCFSTHQFACLIGYGASKIWSSKDSFLRWVLRDLLEFRSDRPSIPVGKVESASSIVQRFCTGGMSLGAISRETHEAIAIAMNRLGKKVSAYIARLRNSKPGVPLISPPPHHDIYSIEDLAQLIFDLHQVNPKAKVSVKLVAEAGLISGHDGGTGASPVSSIKHAGGPWELGLTETQQTLIEKELRERVIRRVDGGFKGGVEILMGAAMGDNEYGFGYDAMIATGCVSGYA
ncbi:hypothetical protein J5N97_014203 [Dioscorea zingiberensis]|uniref:glutamate synthase (ferredoxin) n=1 Tax=Dioscorea zingiberensis TaxID=325984 RepID=A0A9D5CTI8_9LILI|nr:hypothetical protein J5N97_014203 [Dioscorea zingiberensis]